MEKKEMLRIIQNLYDEAEENLTEVALRSEIRNDPNIARRHEELAEGAALIEELGKPEPPAAERIKRLASDVYNNYGHGANNANALISDFERKVEEECADRAMKLGYDKGWAQDTLRAVILHKED